MPLSATWFILHYKNSKSRNQKLDLLKYDCNTQMFTHHPTQALKLIKFRSYFN